LRPAGPGTMGGWMRERRGEELLALPVRLHGIQLGRPVELLLDREARRAVGLDVLCGDEVHRFLPLPTAAILDDEILVLSPLVLLELELEFYRARTIALSRVRGRPVERNRRELGVLQDVVVAEDGRLVAAIVGGERVPFDATLRFTPQRRSAA
jgi:hypothetical protein